MQSDKSLRRGFFSKSLALLGAAFACSKAAAISAATVPQSTPTFPTGSYCTFYQYDEQGQLLGEETVAQFPEPCSVYIHEDSPTKRIVQIRDQV